MAIDLADGAERANAMASVCRAVGDASPMPMLGLEGPGHIVRYVNLAFCLLTTKSRDELLGLPFCEVAPTGAECELLLARVYDTGQAETHTGEEHSATHPFYWSYSMWPMLGADNRPLGIVVQVSEGTSFHQNAVVMNQALMLGSVRQHELTEAAELLTTQLQTEIVVRKKAEEALIDSEKLASAGRMASVLAHEINNPLAAVMNLLYLAQTAGELSDNARLYLQMAEAELKRIVHITRQTLGFYRETLSPTTFGVLDLLHSAADLLQAKIATRKVQVETRCDDGLRMTALHGELRQVLSNLLLNSLDAVDGSGRVTMRASVSRAPDGGEQRVRFTVSDNGKGMSGATMQRIFEPFFTTKGTTGNGLGLWVSRQIVQKQGGSISVRSSAHAPRQGTTFSVVLPLVPRNGSGG